MGSYDAAVLFAAMAWVFTAAEAFANPVVITQDKAMSGGITPGDNPGFPITLSRRGSYIFESDILPTSGANGIEVTMPYVTIDLNGFLLHGSSAASYGITTTGNALTVKDGTIAHFNLDGIRTATAYLIVENMHIVENGGSGASLGNYAKVTGSTISANGGYGIKCGVYCHLEGNIISSNQLTGAFLDSATILGNTIQNNKGYGIYSNEQSGYGNNTLLGNNSGGAQIGGGVLIGMQPNACSPACP
jgi:hypothetical protein